MSTRSLANSVMYLSTRSVAEASMFNKVSGGGIFVSTRSVADPVINQVDSGSINKMYIYVSIMLPNKMKPDLY